MMMILANCLYLISRIRRRIFGGEGDGVDFLIEFFLKGFGLFLSYVQLDLIFIEYFVFMRGCVISEVEIGFQLFLYFCRFFCEIILIDIQNGDRYMDRMMLEFRGYFLCRFLDN